MTSLELKILKDFLSNHYNSDSSIARRLGIDQEYVTRVLSKKITRGENLIELKKKVLSGDFKEGKIVMTKKHHRADTYDTIQEAREKTGISGHLITKSITTGAKTKEGFLFQKEVICQ